MAEREFAALKDKKSAMASDPAAQPAEEPVYPKTSEDDWKSRQRSVNGSRGLLYTVTDDPNEQAMTGDGYSATNGVIKKANDLNDFFQSENSSAKTEVGKKMTKVDHAKPGLVLSAGTAPALDDLVKEDPNGREVETMRGSVSEPNVSKAVSDKYLFTDDGPNQNDVKQNGIGDCYFWGAVLQILAHDPGKISSMMKLNNATVVTTMYYKKNGKWVEDKISRPMGVGALNNQYEKNNKDGGECNIRLDTGKPAESAWNAVILGKSCMINRKDFYKAALWANCLEQAYSDFSRAHGQYGDGMQKAEGEEEYEGGCSDACMRMFYGSKASGAGTFAIQNAGTDKAQNNKVLKALIQFKKDLNGEGGYSALVARRRMGDPNTNSAHAYSIENVTFMDEKGKIIDFTDNKGLFGGISDFFEKRKIDTSKSKILLRNPWNSTSSSEGKFFEVSLKDFIEKDEWTHVRSASVYERTKD